MVDNISVLIDMNVPKTLYKGDIMATYKDILLVAKFNHATGVLKCYEGFHKGMRLRFYPSSNRVYLSNSLHKYWCGNNYSDFSHSMLKDATQRLSDELGMDIAGAKIIKLEFGCNIPVQDVDAVIEGLISYRAKPYQPMLFHGKKYGAACELTKYRVKDYNKSLQVNMQDGKVIDKGLLRHEIAVKSMQCLHRRKIPVPIETVSDLLQFDKLQYLAHELVTVYKDSAKDVVVPIDSLNLREKTAYARMSVPMVRDSYKLKHPCVYREDRRIYNKIINDCTLDYLNQISEQLQQKCTDLLEG